MRNQFQAIPVLSYNGTACRCSKNSTVIDDPSTGHCFDGHAGICHYVAQFFVGYHTVTRFLSIAPLGAHQARMRVDFTGDFGHEIGWLVMSVNAAGLIVRIDADLE